jgi:hypothetical protein
MAYVCVEHGAASGVNDTHPALPAVGHRHRT